MKLRVENEDGTVETITLSGTLSVIKGKYLNRLASSSGSELFFTHDGHYDGCGAGVCKAPMFGNKVIEALEQTRLLEARD